MRNIDLETFYSKYKSTLDIASAYVGEPLLKKLITSCRLKPYSIFNKTFKANKLEYHWVDEFGNSIKLKDNDIHLIENDKLEFDTQISTDLFYGCSGIDILNKSKAIIFAEDYFLFYGTDETFRCYDINHNKRVYPLIMGIENTLIFLKHIDSKFKDFDGQFVLYGLPNKEIEEMIKENYFGG